MHTIKETNPHLNNHPPPPRNPDPSKSACLDGSGGTGTGTPLIRKLTHPVFLGGGGRPDLDTDISAGSYAAAVHAAGAVVTAVDLVMGRTDYSGSVNGEKKKKHLSWLCTLAPSDDPAAADMQPATGQPMPTDNLQTNAN
jgi:hypothetical protein